MSDLNVCVPSRCPQYLNVPPYCVMMTDPSDSCCEKPVCTNPVTPGPVLVSTVSPPVGQTQVPPGQTTLAPLPGHSTLAPNPNNTPVPNPNNTPRPQPRSKYLPILSLSIRWGNFSATGWSAYGLFRGHRYHLKLN